MPDEYALDPISTMFVSKSIFNLVNFRKLSPKMSVCASDDRAIAGVGHVLWSNNISTCIVLNVVKESLVAPTR